MLLWFYISHFVVDIYNSLLDLIMPNIAERIGISVGVGVLILNIVYVTGNILQPLWGYLADKTNKLVFVFFGIVFASVFFPLTVVATDLQTLCVLVFLGALGISFYHPQSMGCVLKNMGVFLMAGSLGFSIAPLVSVAVIKNFGFEAMPYLSIIGLIIAVPMLFISAKKNQNLPKKTKKISFRILLRKAKIKRLSVISIGVGVLISAFGQLTPFLWKEIGRDISYSGMGLFIFYMAGAIGGLSVEKIRKKVGRANTFYFGLVIAWASIMLFLFTIKFEYISMIFLAIIGFISMGLVPLLITTGQQLLPMYKSSVSGIIGGFCYAIACVISVGIGFLCDIIGVIPALGVVSIFPLCCCFFVKGIKVNTYLYPLVNIFKH